MQKLNLEFTQDSIATINDFNTIENKINEVMLELKDLGYTESKNKFNESYYSNPSLYSINVYKYVQTNIIGDRRYYFKAQLKEGKTAISGLYLCLCNNYQPNVPGSTYAWAVNNGVIQNTSALFNSNTPLYISFFPKTNSVETVFDTYDLWIVEEIGTPYEPYKKITYTPKTWLVTDYLLYTYLNNIEDGIKNIGYAYFKPYGWQETKTWSKGMSFSYRDMNRWVNNINLIIDRINTESNTLFPSDTLFPSETLLPH